MSEFSSIPSNIQQSIHHTPYKLFTLKKVIFIAINDFFFFYAICLQRNQDRMRSLKRKQRSSGNEKPLRKTITTTKVKASVHEIADKYVLP